MKKENIPVYSSKKKLFLGILTSLISILITIVLIEAVCWVLLKKRNSSAEELNGFQGRPASLIDANLGVVSPPDTVVTHTRKAGDKVLFNTKYTYGSNGFRITPDSDSSTNANKYALFYGCSFTFGWGLDDKETLAYYFSKDNSEYNSYNFGENGYGPQQMLALLETPTVQNTIKEKDGFAIYTYIDDHVLRVIPGTASLTRLEGKTPYYHLKKEKFTRKGFYSDRYDPKSIVFRIINNSNLFKYFNIGSPFKLKREHYTYTAKIIKAAADEYTRKFKNDNFYVLIYPIPFFYGSNEVFVEELKKLNLKVLDYSLLIDMKSDKYSIIDDWHPRALANEVISKKLTEDISKMSTSK